MFTTPVTTISNANAVPTAKGVDVCPGPLGGVEWNGPAYDPQTKMIYVGAVDWCGHYITKFPGAIAGGVVTYAIGGKQYVATTSGNVSRTTFQTAGSPTLVVMALGVQGSSHDTTLSSVSAEMMSAGAMPQAKQSDVRPGTAKP